MVSLLSMAEPVQLAMTLSMHFLWMAALHSAKRTQEGAVRPMAAAAYTRRTRVRYSRLHW